MNTELITASWEAFLLNTIIAAILALFVWLMLQSASENHYPDIKDL